ncbi:MAG: hypothetical protein MUE63_10505, partial [Xanthomonadales bacterium]|nr:hypothetical protein [Xanthomonadales bacterium]
RGATWTVISGDLTSNNPDWQTYKESGGLTADVTAAENFTTIVAIAPSPLEQGTLWVGTDDGRVHVTRDGGQSWARIDERAKGVPPGTWVPMISPSPHDPGTAFIVFDNHRRGDMQPYAFRVDDYGRDWRNLVSGPVSGYALSLLQDPVDPALLFLGTEFGLFVSTDDGGQWLKFAAGVPTVSVMDMAIQRRENDLVLGTHGRSVYVLDDYSALRGLDAGDFEQRLAILSTTQGQQYTANQTPSTRFTGSGEFRADNEPYGVLITFMASGDDLPHPDEDAERARVARRQAAAAPQADNKDDSGAVIRRQQFPLRQGINRVVWAMDHDGVRPMPTDDPAADAAAIEDGLPPGAEVPAGDYEVTLSLAAGDGNGEAVTATTRVSVLPDPRSDISAAARLSNYQALLELQALQEQAVTAVERIARARADITTVRALLERHEQPGGALPETLQALNERAGAVGQRLDELEQRFRTPPKTRGIVYDDDKVATRIGLAMGYVGSSRDAPTPTAEVYVQAARQALAAATAELERFAESELADFGQAVSAAGIGLFGGAGQH